MSRALRTFAAALGLAGAFLALGACHDGEELSPLAVVSTGAGGQGSGGAPPDAGAPRRQIITRDPFGDVAATQNLLFDGDFEWYSPFADQYGWFSANGAAPDTRIGAVCASGVRCAVIGPNRTLIGLGVASAGHALAVSVKVKSADCGSVSVVLDSQGTDPPFGIPAPAAPGSDGFCTFSALAPEHHAAIVLVVDNNGTKEALLDDALVVPVPVGAALQSPLAVEPTNPELRAHLADMRATVRRAQIPRDLPPNATRSAFQEWMRRRQLR